jgi:AcrR family transcriptional regulator
MQRRGRTQAERRAETRGRLVQAALTVFARRGFHAASVAEIADEAGLSTGALYSHFVSKDDLFLACMDEHVEWLVEVMRRTRSSDERAQEWMAYLDESGEKFLLFIEFWAYAQRTPEIRAKFAERMSQMRAAIAEGLEGESAELAALAGVVLARGVALERLADPAAVPDDFYARLLRLVLPETAGARVPG